MKSNRFYMAIFLLIILLICMESSNSFASKITVRLPNGLYVKKEIASMKEQRYTNLIRQRYDLSCGAASLATILNYYYNDNIDEAAIIRQMLEHGDKQRISEKGFSLLDIKQFAEKRDYVAAGYKDVPIENIKKMKVPSIVLLTSKRYSHFVVLRAIQNEKVYIADPAFGNRSMSITEFKKGWNGILFIVVSKNKKVNSNIPLESVRSAKKLNILAIQKLGMSGFSYYQTPGEF